MGLDFRSEVRCMSHLICKAAITHIQIYSIIPILISRFIFNLRQAGETAQSLSRPFRIASIVFRVQKSIVGNMGESLSLGLGGEAEDIEQFEGDSNDGDVGIELSDMLEPEQEDHDDVGPASHDWS